MGSRTGKTKTEKEKMGNRAKRETCKSDWQLSQIEKCNSDVQ